ncbi:MAG TPA: hypothetical protein VFS08_12945 [Gemmatimonadaceae bacterium]|nr:hypothetical protein [Gemmatimonadaceae bacterium]
MLDPRLGLASGLVVFVGAGHSYIGERRFLPRLFQDGPTTPRHAASASARAIVRFVWHLVTVCLWGMAALIVVLGGGDARAGLRVLAATIIACAAVTAVGSRGRHPAWGVFVLAATALWLGTP